MQTYFNNNKMNLFLNQKKLLMKLFLILKLIFILSTSSTLMSTKKYKTLLLYSNSNSKSFTVSKSSTPNNNCVTQKFSQKKLSLKSLIQFKNNLTRRLKKQKNLKIWLNQTQKSIKYSLKQTSSSKKSSKFKKYTLKN